MRSKISASINTAYKKRQEVRIRILRQPRGSISGLDLSHYRPKLVYDVPATLGTYLVVSGYARMEMRITENPQPPFGVERRLQASR
jgi:hypothetical protein